jgi:hypothetical protein
MPPKPNVPRKRNLLFDALADLEGGASGLTPLAGSAIGKWLREIKWASPGVTPEEIRRRVANYKTHMSPDVACTAAALAKHWAKCAMPKVTIANTPTPVAKSYEDAANLNGV